MCLTPARWADAHNIASQNGKRCGLYRLECEQKITVVGRLSGEDGEPSFDGRFDGVGRYARFADCDIAEVSKTLQ